MLYELNTKELLEKIDQIKDFTTKKFTYKLEVFNDSKYRKAGIALIAVNRYGEPMVSTIISTKKLKYKKDYK